MPIKDEFTKLTDEVMTIVKAGEAAERVGEIEATLDQAHRLYLELKADLLLARTRRE
jgi:hypothetical protein